jgi:hypothetical protein
MHASNARWQIVTFQQQINIRSRGRRETDSDHLRVLQWMMFFVCLLPDPGLLNAAAQPRKSHLRLILPSRLRQRFDDTEFPSFNITRCSLDPPSSDSLFFWYVFLNILTFLLRSEGFMGVIEGVNTVYEHCRTCRMNKTPTSPTSPNSYQHIILAQHVLCFLTYIQLVAVKARVKFRAIMQRSASAPPVIMGRRERPVLQPFARPKAPPPLFDDRSLVEIYTRQVSLDRQKHLRERWREQQRPRRKTH